jgi:two-component system chemotaxis response regulator CheY
MYTIGELSKVVKVSVDALRYYDEIGLLKPHHVDPSSRYRYYSSDQVNEMIFIMELKRYGFSLDAIRELLDCRDCNRLRDIYQTKMQQLLAERNQLEDSIQLLQKQMNRWGDGNDMEKQSVLIIDDVAFMRQILQEILEKHGFKVVGVAADGEAGVSMYNTLKPELVVLDIGMPGIDGIEVLRRIRQCDGEADTTRIVMCSAKATASMITSCLKEGADDFVAKPFQAEYLIDALNSKHKRQYEPSAIVALLEGAMVAEEEETLPQESINELLNLCTKHH